VIARPLVNAIVVIGAVSAWAQPSIGQVASPGSEPASRSSKGQVYPVRPIRLVVPLAAGGGVDTSARLVGQKLAEVLGQQVVIENRPGAGGTIATEMVARAAPDGYTLVMASPSHAITASLYKLAFDPVKDFAPITLAVIAPYVIVVHPSLPVRSVKDLLAFAKTRPNELLWSSSGNGSAPHLALELLEMMTGVKIMHVPYKGSGPGITDLIAGRVSVTASSIPSVMSHVNAGRLRALAVASRTRSQIVPQLPTVAETGIPGYEIDVWHGMMAPAGTPREIIARLHAETAKIITQRDVRERMLAVGLEPVGDPPDQFAAYVRAEVAKWAKVIQQADIRVD
jgi:tripartite-type tricarboxylate transporter receptor subunit TctC